MGILISFLILQRENTLTDGHENNKFNFTDLSSIEKLYSQTKTKKEKIFVYTV